MTDISGDGSHEWRISDMDCAACTRKIQTAVEGLPGVSWVKITLMNERLRLTLAAKTTGPAQVERAMRALGYGITAPAIPAHEAAPTEDHTTETHPDHSPKNHADLPTDQHWYATAKARLVFFTGILLTAAQIANWTLLADDAIWAFTLACLIGLLPVARKALAALRAVLNPAGFAGG